MRRAVYTVLVLLSMLPVRCLADVTELTEPSVEWLADSSDAIAICKIASEDARSPKRNYRVVELVKPHESLREGQSVWGSSVLGEVGDRVIVFFREADGALNAFRVTSFVRPAELQYSFQCGWVSVESEARAFLGVDARGALIETPGDLVRKLKERMAVSPGLPEDLGIEIWDKGGEESTVSPSGFEYDNGYDVLMNIVVPPDVRTRIDTERATRGEFPRPATARERGAIHVAKNLFERDVTAFIRGTEEEMPFVEEYLISPTGKYVLNTADGRLVVLNTAGRTVIWEDVHLWMSPYLRFVENDTLLIYGTGRGKGQIVALDLNKGTALPPIVPLSVEDNSFGTVKLEVDPGGAFVAVYYRTQSWEPAKRVIQVWEIETGKLLANLPDSPYFQRWGSYYRSAWGEFSPKSTFLIMARNAEIVLWKWRTGEEELRIPVDWNELIDSPVLSPDESKIAVLHRVPYSRAAKRAGEITRATIWDVSTDRRVCKIPVPKGAFSVKFLDNESLVALADHREVGGKKGHVLRWDSSAARDDTIHYSVTTK